MGASDLGFFPTGVFFFSVHAGKKNQYGFLRSAVTRTTSGDAVDGAREGFLSSLTNRVQPPEPGHPGMEDGPDGRTRRLVACRASFGGP